MHYPEAMRRAFAICCVAGFTLNLAPPVRAQGPLPAATSLATLERFPTYFHGRTVTFVSTPELINGLWRVPRQAGDSRAFVILPREGSPPARAVELRGQLFDVGQLDRDDSRISTSGLRGAVERLYGTGWPERGALFALVGATWSDDRPIQAIGASLRAVVLHPDAFDGQRVTVRGRFRAQNLYGDLPAWPRKTQWDFVLQSADASLWVTGMRPRGRQFDLDPRQRRGAGTWLEVTGVVRIADAMPTIEAASIATAPPEAEPEPPPVAARPAVPEPTVVFSVPLEGEIGVDPSIVVRIQFSRHMLESSFAEAVAVTYGGDPAPAPPAFKAVYQPQTRALEIRFAAPLRPDADVVIQLREGIVAADKARLSPVTIRFRTKAGDQFRRSLSRPSIREAAPQSPPARGR